MIHLVTGGARAGKSSFVLSDVEKNVPTGSIGFLATAEAIDPEMRLRIDRHRLERGPRYQTIEEPLVLGEALDGARRQHAAVIVDCLTVWMGTLLWKAPDSGREEWILTQTNALLRALTGPGAPVWLVTNEVGFGIVPEHPVAREYRDRLGRLNQQVAATADRVSLLVCGIPMQVKG